MNNNLNDIDEIIKKLTLEEKLLLLTGEDMSTHSAKRLGVDPIKMADGPHGVRGDISENCVSFPNLCSLGSSWDTDMAKKMGAALAYDCKKHDVSMLLAPGINIKRTPFCGRNFEYLSEDPIVAGKLAEGYVNGLQENGVSCSLKHFAANNQELYRQTVSAEIDERTLREIYLKAFEIVVKNAKPDTVMCSYNKINGVWASENPFLLTDILKDEWGFEGLVISDWGAVQNSIRAFKAGLDLQMYENIHIVSELSKGLESGNISMERIDDAVKRVLKVILKERDVKLPKYDRKALHETAKEIAQAGMVLLKNENNVLPLTEKKYKKIGILGGYAENPLISGLGSADVLVEDELIDKPLKELKKLMPNTEFAYKSIYDKATLPTGMIWPTLYSTDNINFIKSCDAVVIFAGSMSSEDTEKMDRITTSLNPIQELVINMTSEHNENVIVVLQNGSALTLGDWRNKVSGILEMWLGGEAGGSAVAELLCGKANPSGKLAETFAKCQRTDLQYPGNREIVEYNEGFDVGYRYYDKHPDEIMYPFGYGLSYTKFEYSNLEVTNDDEIKVRFKLKNIGDVEGAEVVQLYISDVVSTVKKPVKELKKFDKVFLLPNETKTVEFVITKEDLQYYNTTFKKWMVENGEYKILIGASSQDIRLEAVFDYQADMEYSLTMHCKDMIG